MSNNKERMVLIVTVSYLSVDLSFLFPWQITACGERETVSGGGGKLVISVMSVPVAPDMGNNQPRNEYRIWYVQPHFPAVFVVTESVSTTDVKLLHSESYYLKKLGTSV